MQRGMEWSRGRLSIIIPPCYSIINFLQTQNLLKAIIDIQTENPCERIAQKLNACGQMGSWSKEEVQRKVEISKTEILLA